MQKLNSKIFVTFLTSFVLSLCIITINEHSRKSELRRISGIDPDIRSDYSEICASTSNSFKEKQQSEYYTYNQDVNGNGDIIEYLKERDTSSLTNYIIGLAVWIFFIGFGLLTIFIWIFYCCWCCCCKNCCCCCSQNRDNICKQIGFFGSVGFLAASAVLSISAMAISNQFVHGINGSFCGIYKLYETFIDGEVKTTFPKWAGTQGIVNILTQSKVEIQGSITGNTSLINQKYNDIVGADNSIKTSEDAYCGSADGSELVVCKYIYNEFTIFQQINSQFEQIRDFQNFASIFDDAVVTIQVMESQINDNIKDLVSSVADIEKLIDKYMSLLLKILFSFNVVIACVEGGILLLMFLFNMKNFLFKLLYNLSWNVVCFLSIYTFIIGGIFGIFGNFGVDGGMALGYIFSEENLNQSSPIILESETDKLNQCLNKDGNLSQELNFKSSGFEGISQLYNSAAKISELQANATSMESSIEEVSSTTKNYKNMHIMINEGFNISLDATNALFAIYQRYAQSGDMFSAFNCSILLY